MSTTAPPKAPTRGTVTVPVRLDAETRSATGELKLSGIAVPYEAMSEDIGFREIIQRGAFRSSIEDADTDVMLLWMHDHRAPLARQSAGNLEVRETPEGVRFSATLPNTTLARDAIELVRAGVIQSMSFGFVSLKDRWEQRNGEQVRVVTSARLHECSLVGEPAYSQTNVQNRNRGESKLELQRRIERTVARHRLNRPTITTSPYRPGSEHLFFRDLTVLALERQRRAAAIVAGVDRIFGSLGDPSVMRDLVHGGPAEARARLAQLGRHLGEVRDLTTSTTDGGGFVPGSSSLPVHLGELFSAAVRSRGVLPQILDVRPLPERGMTVGSARISTGIGTEVQATENVAASEADIIEGKLSSPVSTLIGFEDCSVQLLDRADPTLDEVLAVELGRALGEEADLLFLTGSGTAPNCRGLDAVSGITSTSYTDNSPTWPEAWAKVVECAADVATALGTEPTVALMHPRRMLWFAAWRDSSGSAPTPAPWAAIGLRPVACGSVTTTAGASTNEDVVYILRPDELPIFLGDVRFEVQLQVPTNADNLTARIRAVQYVSSLPQRRPEAIGRISGTGFVVPASY